MSDFVLVHGAWHGAWCWKKVLPALWAAGHRAFAVTLTGVGERVHIDPRQVTLQTHILDVASVIEAEELNGAILVGHSYGGVVITGVAERMAHRLSHLVYLDAALARPGESWSSGHSPETRNARRQTILESGTLPPPDPAIYGLEGADAAWVARRQTPQPGCVYEAPLEFDPERIAALPRTYVSCTSPQLQTIDSSRARARSEPGWKFVELATGHDPMVSAPEDLVRLLLSTA